jgi:ribosome-binding protein aMBF1 (putative translation factor)
MIRSDAEYKEAVERLRDEAGPLKDQHDKLRELGLSRDEIKRAIDPLRSFHEQLQEEVTSYERLKRGEFDEIRNFQGMGRLLIALRIAQGLSQRELAERLGDHESQVSRDERNEYHGTTLERAGRVLDALDVELESSVKTLGRFPSAGRVGTITV